MTLRHPTLALAALVVWGIATEASALGFGGLRASLVMGQGVDVTIPVRLDPGETLTDDCLTATVAFGDSVLPRSLVRAGLEGSSSAPVVRVRSSARIDEPVVTLNISVGCSPRVAREFTLFADPPGIPLAGPQVADANALAVAAPQQDAGGPSPTGPVSSTAGVPAPVVAPPAQAAAAASLPAAPTLSANPLSEPVRPSSPASRAESRLPPVAPVQPPRLAATRPPAEPAKPKPKPTATPSPQAKAPAGPATAAPAARKSAQEPAARPRLKLDAPPMSAAAAAAAASAAEREIALKAAESAASAARTAAAEAANRVASLEKGIEALRAEALANREAVERLNRQLAEAESRAGWMPVLAGGVVVLLGACAWLALRLRRRPEEAPPEWWMSQSTGTRAAAPPTEMPEDSIFPLSVQPDPTPDEPGRAAPRVASPPSPRPDKGSDSPMEATVVLTGPGQTTRVLPPGDLAGASPARELSVEELLDLEQQAEFFTVLGQDDAAIDLLQDHLRGTGGTVPLPFLKLMEIYQRLGDRDAYERLRERFNQRFNALAPAWGTDQSAGRSLEDYPAIVARLQADWARPLDSMATLETLLFRGDGGQLFDLPAYRDVLFLYMLAHDLAGDGTGRAPRVDVMLPLGNDNPMSADARKAVAPVETVDLDIQIEEQVTMPLPLDLPKSPGKPGR